mmetsp:Transcript_21912/g.54115  ORF Transcript_21912/g.54115 Transcript_21912/m.54115 type:complete len:107 (+) Transcript_21912:371-691(+)
MQNPLFVVVVKQGRKVIRDAGVIEVSADVTFEELFRSVGNFEGKSLDKIKVLSAAMGASSSSFAMIEPRRLKNNEETLFSRERLAEFQLKVCIINTFSHAVTLTLI